MATSLHELPLMVRMPLSDDQMRLLMAEIAELQRIGYGEIRIEVWRDRIDIMAVTRTVKMTDADQVLARLEELERHLD